MKNSVTFREKIGYGFGDMASSMFWKIFGMYLLFFYTKVFGITPAAAGTMFLVTRIWDSIPSWACWRIVPAADGGVIVLTCCGVPFPSPRSEC